MVGEVVGGEGEVVCGAVVPVVLEFEAVEAGDGEGRGGGGVESCCADEGVEFVEFAVFGYDALGRDALDVVSDVIDVVFDESFEEARAGSQSPAARSESWFEGFHVVWFLGQSLLHTLFELRLCFCLHFGAFEGDGVDVIGICFDFHAELQPGFGISFEAFYLVFVEVYALEAQLVLRVLT